MTKTILTVFLLGHGAVSSAGQFSYRECHLVVMFIAGSCEMPDLAL